MTKTVSLSETLSEFVFETDYHDLPTEVLNSTKLRMLDTIGVAWAGSTAPGCDSGRQVTLAEGTKEVSTFWASGERAGCRGAAFVNGMHAAALDYDTVYEKGSVHPDIVVVPAAWAIAERIGADGKALLTAIAVGNEIACRLGSANRENRGWFYTSLHGVFGATAAVGKLLGLSVEEISNALGLALTRAAGTQQALIEKSLAKRVQSGFAAESGVFAAQLAAGGITGPREAIEGKFGYHALYGAGEHTPIIDKLGTHYESLSITIKKYPSCTANHVPIELLIQLVEAQDLAAGDVDSVEVAISPFANGLVGGAFDPSSNAQVAAQFSVHYSVASILLRRKLGIAEIQDNAIYDERVADLIPKVTIRIDENNLGKFAPASIKVRTTDGELFENSLKFVPGTLENPLSDAQVTTKFQDCVSFGMCPMSNADAEAFLNRLSGVDEMASIEGVFDGIYG